MIKTKDLQRANQYAIQVNTALYDTDYQWVLNKAKQYNMSVAAYMRHIVKCARQSDVKRGG